MSMVSYSRNPQNFFTSTGVKTNAAAPLTEDERNQFIHSVASMNPDVKDPFYVLDMGLVKCLMDKWNTNLPSIKPFYAVKCNSEPAFLSLMDKLGANFECFSQMEIEAVLAIGVTSDRIVLANTCKPISHIRYAASVGVDIVTFDSACEVEKIKKCHPKCNLLLRIKVGNDCYARRPLGNKFGALPEEVSPLLQAASEAGLHVAGVSFHLGSAVTHPEAYHIAMASAKEVFDTAVQLGMPRMHIVDVGGGFTAGPQFDVAADIVRSALKSNFSDVPGLEVISEPGRFFAETAFTLVTNVYGKRVRGNRREYWINDGLYGSMMNMLHDPDRVIGAVKPLAYESHPENPTCQGEKTIQSTVYGPIANSLDTVLTDFELPELKVNDWLVFHEMGAYSAAAGSKFNGFDTSAIPTYLAYSKRNELVNGKGKHESRQCKWQMANGF